jgi:hypothetical protein
MGRRKKTEIENKYSNKFKKLVLEAFPSNRKVKKFVETNDYELGRILTEKIQISVIPMGKKVLKTKSLREAKEFIQQEILKEKAYHQWHNETENWDV